MKCKFNVAWRGECEKETVDGNEYCEEHIKERCCVCGQQATHQCPCTSGLVCGAPLCDDCEHTISENGTTGGPWPLPKAKNGLLYKEHCRKTDQIYKVWYRRKRSRDKFIYKNKNKLYSGEPQKHPFKDRYINDREEIPVMIPEGYEWEKICGSGKFMWLSNKKTGHKMGFILMEE